MAPSAQSSTFTKNLPLFHLVYSFSSWHFFENFILFIIHPLVLPQQTSPIHQYRVELLGNFC